MTSSIGVLRNAHNLPFFCRLLKRMRLSLSVGAICSATQLNLPLPFPPLRPRLFSSPISLSLSLCLRRLASSVVASYRSFSSSSSCSDKKDLILLLSSTLQGSSFPSFTFTWDYFVKMIASILIRRRRHYHRSRRCQPNCVL